MANKVLVLNGPPRSGKDMIKDHLRNLFPDTTDELRFAKPLKDGVHKLLLLDVDTEDYNDVKDTNHEDFYGALPRNVYIQASEGFMKPIFGDDIFGRLWVRQYHQKYGGDSNAPVVMISDCGFREELEPLKDYFSPENVIIVRLYRYNHDFAGDSRNYLFDTGCPEFNVFNEENQQDKTVQDVMNILEETGILASM